MVAGSYGPDVSTTRAFVARLTASGSPDPDFAFGGTLSFPTPGDPSDCRSVTIDAIRIVAGCTTGITGGKDLYIWGMTLSGATDPTFASTLIDLGSTQDKMFAMFKHPDGRFIAAGRGGAGNSQLAVIAVDANGGRASAFGTNGVFLAPESDTGDGGAIGWNGNEIVAVSRRTVAVKDDAVTTALSITGARTSVTYSTLSFSYGDYIRPKVLADGRILAIGNMSFGTKGAFRVSRFLPGGSLDATFGGGGHTSFFTEDNWTWGARDFVLQPDGNIVLTGGFGAQPPLSPEQTLGAARVLGNGGLDPAFNAGPSAGQSSFVVPNTFNASAGRAVRLQGDGKILLASRYVPASAAGREMLAVRFNADGTRDTGYGINGLATSAFVIGATQCRAMDLDGNGRAVLMGDGAGEVRLTRFTTSGTLDPSFGTGGMAAFPLPAGHSLLFASAMGFVLPNGKILAVLNASKGTDGEVGLMQANANGTLDTTFGNGGFSFVTVSAGTANNGNAFHAAIAPNGRIAIVGFGSLGTVTYVPMLARFMPDGRPDSSFGSGGVRFYALPADSWLIGVAFAADGSMILTGSTSAGGRIFANVIKTVADGNAIGPNLVNAFSRKHHAGQSGAFDLRLDPVAGISGPIFVEPRASGMGHTIVFRFDTTIASVGSTTVEDANGISLGNPTPVFSGNEVSILLPPIADMTRAKVRATGVNGLTSVEVNVGFLFGDITGSRKINAADISAIKRRMGQSITAGDNFAYDVNTNGSIDGVDLSIVKWRSGKLLPLLAVD
ncbi:MAG: hypothetical protein IPP88_06545 [Betaproteobacteria bacterium]|nr:hypothetical protein [Betaproteobacteria bacterium]